MKILKNKGLKALIIDNYLAGGHSDRESSKIRSILCSKSSRLEEVRFVTTKSLSDLERTVEENKGFHPHIIGFCGGDGAATRTLTAIYNSWGYIPKNLAIFGTGTVVNCAIPVHLSGGIPDKIRKKFRQETSSIKLAKYLSEADELKTESLDLLDINGKKGFSFGVGIAKPLWLYYGKPIELYEEIISTAEKSSKEDYDAILEDALNNHEALRAGALYSCFAVGMSLVGCLKKDSKTNSFFSQRMEAEIWADGKKIGSREDYLGIYVGMGYVGFGFNGIYLEVIPKAMREKGKIQLAATWINPSKIPHHLRKLYRGEHIPNTQYNSASKSQIISGRPELYFIDGEWGLDDRFDIEHYQIQNGISPFL